MFQFFDCFVVVVLFVLVFFQPVSCLPVLNFVYHILLTQYKPEYYADVVDFVTYLCLTETSMGVLSESLLGAETQKGRKQSFGHNINVSAIPTVSSCLQSTEEEFLRSLRAFIC